MPSGGFIVVVGKADGDLLSFWSDEALLTERRGAFRKDLEKSSDRH
jgi:hypothetical protein